jgi:hypothetical protein
MIVLHLTILLSKPLLINYGAQLSKYGDHRYRLRIHFGISHREQGGRVQWQKQKHFPAEAAEAGILLYRVQEDFYNIQYGVAKKTRVVD